MMFAAMQTPHCPGWNRATAMTTDAAAASSAARVISASRVASRAPGRNPARTSRRSAARASRMMNIPARVAMVAMAIGAMTPGWIWGNQNWRVTR